MAILDEMQAAKEAARGKGTRKQSYVWRIGWSAQPGHPANGVDRTGWQDDYRYGVSG